MAKINKRKKIRTKEDLQKRFLPEARYESVEKKAYELYQKKGYLPGEDMTDWFAAEKLVEEEMKRSK